MADRRGSDGYDAHAGPKVAGSAIGLEAARPREYNWMRFGKSTSCNSLQNFTRQGETGKPATKYYLDFANLFAVLASRHAGWAALS
jgi:hypothetical protein